jgi:hypothetical protein
MAYTVDLNEDASDSKEINMTERKLDLSTVLTTTKKHDLTLEELLKTSQEFMTIVKFIC